MYGLRGNFDLKFCRYINRKFCWSLLFNKGIMFTKIFQRYCWKFLLGIFFEVEVLREESTLDPFSKWLNKNDYNFSWPDLTSVVWSDPLVVSHLKTVEYGRNVHVSESVLVTTEKICFQVIVRTQELLGKSQNISIVINFRAIQRDTLLRARVLLQLATNPPWFVWQIY